MPRLEDDRLLLGLGTYIDDFDPGQCWHAVFFRSQVSSGLVASMDVTKACSCQASRVFLRVRTLLD